MKNTTTDGVGIIKLVSIPMVILLLSIIFIFSQSRDVFALSGLIDSTIQDMESGDSSGGSSGGSSTCSGCSSTCTTNCSAGGSLTDQINTVIDDMEETYTVNTNTDTSNTGPGSSYTPLSQPSCPFTASSNRHVVDLGEDIRADASLSRSRFTVNSNIPSGRYDIRVFSWDEHSNMPVQNQNHEQAVLRLYNSSGTTLYTTNRTQDIPDNSNSITSTVASNINISQAIREILVFHPEYPSSNPESHVPICAEFRMISDPVDPDPDDLEVECRVSDTRIEEGDTVEFEAIVTGGDSPYDYDWDGDVSSSQRQFEVRFNDEGNYYIDVTVTDDDGNTDSDYCPVIVVDEEDDDWDWDDDDLEIQCELSDSTIDEGDYVTIEVDIDGGNSPFDIEWDRDADEIRGFDLDDRYQRIRVRDAGTYRLRVTVEDDDGNRDSDTCTLRVRDEDDDDDRNINVYSGGGLDRLDGDLAGLSSVYLNQVPYTGPEDNLKIFGFIALILIWSSTISYYVLRGKNKKKVSDRIEAFKQANKEKLVA